MSTAKKVNGSGFGSMFSGYRVLAVALLVTVLPQIAVSASAEINYLLHCSGCHLPEGQGNPPNVPTLQQELGRMMGVAEMRTYLVRVPGSAYSSLSDDELTAVANWILQEFNAETLPADFEPLSTLEVTRARKDSLPDPLKYRIEHWRDYAQ
ncbi:MAG: cytochrome c [Pseudohongiellaceae bacterium]